MLLILLTACHRGQKYLKSSAPWQPTCRSFQTEFCDRPGNLRRDKKHRRRYREMANRNKQCVGRYFPRGNDGGIYGMAIDSNTLYALEYNPVSFQSTLWRFTAPLRSPTTIGWTGISTNGTTDTSDLTVALNTEPQALKASTNKLWAVKTNGTNKLYSFTDTIIDISITLNTPQNNYLSYVNSKTGHAYDIVFSWQRPTTATEYELQIAATPDFSQLLGSIIVDSASNIVSALAGPDQAGASHIDFSPNDIYYWRVRTTLPGYSQFSAVRKFSIEPLPVPYYQGYKYFHPPIAPRLQTRHRHLPGSRSKMPWNMNLS